MVNKHNDKPTKVWGNLLTSRSFWIPPRSTNRAANFLCAPRALMSLSTSGSNSATVSWSLLVRCNNARHTSTPFSCKMGPSASTYSPRISRHWIQYISRSWQRDSWSRIVKSSKAASSLVSSGFGSSGLVLDWSELKNAEIKAQMDYFRLSKEKLATSDKMFSSFYR